MKKSELKNGMIVRTSGGRYGVVVIKDATDENCIKFLYDPMWLPDHGYINEENCLNVIVDLAEFDDRLAVLWTEEDERRHPWDGKYNEENIGGRLWWIEEVYELNSVWKHKEEKDIED